MKKKVDSANIKSYSCFIISPIGEKGTEKHRHFKDTYDYIIKPAITASGYDFEITRADDIERPGSFIKDILENIFNSYVVIADLSGQNANVFYELGVRHALSPRTILIAQSIDDIPSDLREYRTIVYDNSAKGLKDFTDKLITFFKEIFKDPSRSDNPVIDRLGSMIENKTKSLEADISSLNKELARTMQKGIKKKRQIDEESIYDKTRRILSMSNAQDQTTAMSGGFVVFGSEKTEKEYYLKKDQGNFKLYFIMERESTIADYWYLAVQRSVKIENEMADIRVLMESCLNKDKINFKFIIATEQDLSKNIPYIKNYFTKMLNFVPKVHRKRFALEIWDKEGVLMQEKKLGLKIDID